jgi:hypothetical protein
MFLLLAQPLVFFRAVLFNHQSHIPFDLEAFHLPLVAYVARCAREGVFPFWDPYPYCGVPIHADLTAQLYYPFTWVSILLGNLAAGHTLLYWIEWLVPFHMILAGWFTFLLLREFGVGVPPALFGATVYQLSGFFASQAQHLGAVCCGAWLPLVLLCVWKLHLGVTPRWMGLLALSVGLSILAGFPATTLVTFSVAALFAIGVSLDRRPGWKFFVALAGGAALGISTAAVQLIPTYQLTRLSIATMRSEWSATGGGLRVQSLASLAAPNYYHIFTPYDPSLYRLPINFVFLYVYCGIFALVLVMLAPFLRRAPYSRMFFVFTVISAIWMLGDETPLYRFMYSRLPHLVRGALYAEFALLAFCMFAALTAAVTLQHVAARAPAWLLWCIALVTAVDLIYFGADRPMNSAPGGYTAENSEYEISGYPGALTKIRDLVGSTIPPWRIDYLDRDPWTFVWGSDLLKLPTADGDNPFMLKRIYLLRRLFCSGSYWEREEPVSRLTSPLVRMLNVRFLAGHSARPPDGMRTRFPLAAEIAGLRFYRVPDSLPRFYLVSRVRVSSGPDETFSYLARSDFDPAQEALVEANDLRPLDSLGSGVIHVERYSPNRIELKVSAAGRAFLATSEPLYPGWTAWVNGHPARLYMTNGAFRGMMLDPGANQIVMTYWPPGFFIWVAMSGASVLVAVGLAFGRSLLSTPGRSRLHLIE